MINDNAQGCVRVACTRECAHKPQRVLKPAAASVPQALFLQETFIFSLFATFHPHHDLKVPQQLSLGAV
jgi:hypothetical protein